MNREQATEALSEEDFVQAIMDSQEQPEAETEAEETEEEAEETPEVAEDQPEAESDETEEDDAEPQDDDVYQIGDETFTLAELKEWKSNGLKDKDYTQKSQKLSSEKKQFEADRASWDAEKVQYVQQIQQQQAQLTDALAAHAIAPLEEPNWAELKPEQIGPALAEFNQAKAQKAQAQKAYQDLQRHQMQETQQREMRSLLQHFPDWSDYTVFQTNHAELVEVAGQYGFTPEEVAATVDHRMYRILHALRTAQAATATEDAAASKASKKLVKAAKKLPPGAKPAKVTAAKKVRQEQKRQLKKTGDLKDFQALLMGE